MTLNKIKKFNLTILSTLFLVGGGITLSLSSCSITQPLLQASGDNEVQWLPNTKAVATAAWLGFSDDSIEYRFDSHGHDKYFTLNDSNKTASAWHLIFTLNNPTETTDGFIISVYFQVHNTKYIQKHDIKIDQYNPTPSTITISGSTAETIMEGQVGSVQYLAYDNAGQDITNEVSWELETAPNGVSLSTTIQGLLEWDTTASGGTFIIRATKLNFNDGTLSGTLTLVKPDPTPATITISGSTDQTIVKGQTGNSQYQAFDDLGQDITNEVSWELVTAPNGVSLSATIQGLLEWDTTASGGTFIIRATKLNFNDGTLSGTLTLVNPPMPDTVITGNWTINKGADPASFCPNPKTDVPINDSISICTDYFYEQGDPIDKISAISNQLKADFTYFMNESVSNIAGAIIFYKEIDSYSLNIKFTYDANQRLFSDAEVNGSIKYKLMLLGTTTTIDFHLDMHNYLLIGAFSANHANLSYSDPYNSGSGHKKYNGDPSTGNCLGLTSLDKNSFYHFKIKGGSGLIDVEHTYWINAVKYIGIEDIGEKGNEAGVYIKSWYLKGIQTIYPINLSSILSKNITLDNYWTPGNMGAFTDQAGSDGWNNKNVNSVDSSSLFDKCVGNEWRDIVIPYDKNKTITLSYQQIIDKIWALDSGGKVAVNIYFSYCFYSGDSWLYSYSPENINFNNNP